MAYRYAVKLTNGAVHSGEYEHKTDATVEEYGEHRVLLIENTNGITEGFPLSNILAWRIHKPAP